MTARIKFSKYATHSAELIRVRAKKKNYVQFSRGEVEFNLMKTIESTSRVLSYWELNWSWSGWSGKQLKCNSILCCQSISLTFPQWTKKCFYRIMEKISAEAWIVTLSIYSTFMKIDLSKHTHTYTGDTFTQRFCLLSLDCFVISACTSVCIKLGNF